MKGGSCVILYDKDKIKQSLTLEQVYSLLVDFGGEPIIKNNTIISKTICHHNLMEDCSHKLYYYDNSKLFQCYTTGSNFDVFELVIKIHQIQKNQKLELYDAVRFIAYKFGFSADKEEEDDNQLRDWEMFKRYDFEFSFTPPSITLPSFDKTILSRFSYPRILPWEREGIDKEVALQNYIGYYPVTEQITIPHFDINGNLVGIRGRYLAQEDADKYGKYRPLIVNKQMYNHPLSLNLYNINNSKDNISQARAAIIFESEKSCLMYQSYYGLDNDISVACCGSNISSHQIDMLCNLGAKEIVIGFDKQFQKIGDDEFTVLKNKLVGLYKRYGSQVRITTMFDTKNLLPYKASPIDISKEIFEQLLKSRFVPNK